MVLPLVLPLIPLAGVAAASLGIYVLAWYHGLSREEQREADLKANELAVRLYNTGLNKLTKLQVEHVHNLVKKQFSE